MKSFKRMMSIFQEVTLIRQGKVLFYKLPQEIEKFMKQNQTEGLKNPLLTELQIIKSSGEYKICFITYYKTPLEDKYNVKTIEKIYSDLLGIPKNIEKKLIENGKLRIKINNILEFLLESNNEISSEIKFHDLGKLIKHYQAKISNDKILKRKLNITDTFFQKKLIVTLEGEKKTYERSFYFQDIIDLPNDILSVMEEKGMVELSL